MARPREFDEMTVLEAAMNCFWAQGFEQTSVRDLAEQMGITGASLYNAFGDKRSLYRQAFVHYLEQTVRDRVARLEKLPPALAIRTFFDEIIERSVDDEQRRGCMLVNAALELAPYDPEFQKLVAEEMMFIEAFFRRCVAAGQKDGSIAGTPSGRRTGQVAVECAARHPRPGADAPAARGAGRRGQRGCWRCSATARRDAHFRLIDLKQMISSSQRGDPSPRADARRGSVTRLTDLPPDQAKRLAELECPDFETRPWVTGPALSQRRVAIVSSAGLVVRGEDPFRGRDPALSRDPRDDPGRRPAVQPHLDQFRPHRVAGRLERRLSDRPAAGAGGRGDDRLGGRYALFVHGRDRSLADGAACPRTRRPPETGQASTASSSPPFDRSARAP